LSGRRKKVGKRAVSLLELALAGVLAAAGLIWIIRSLWGLF